MSKKSVSLSLFILLIFLLKPLQAIEVDTIQNDDLLVQFEKSLRNGAREIIEIYPAVKKELEKTFRWKMDFKSTVVIIKDNDTFQRMATSNLIVAFAIPHRNLIVIDYSRIKTPPFTIKITLKHELSHLFLHNAIRQGNLPKWLDEGISQWVSDGIADIIMDRKGAVLKEATLSGRLIGIRDLKENFPEDEKSLLLAYEESKSIVEYISREFGTSGILQVLNHLRNGDDIDEAISKGISIPLEELEKRWHRYLKKRTTWFIYLSNNLYKILFLFASLITIYGFIMFLIKKRAYKDDEENIL